MTEATLEGDMDRRIQGVEMGIIWQESTLCLHSIRQRKVANMQSEELVIL